MIHRERLALQAVHSALRMRVRLGRPLDRAVCPYDLAIAMGIALRFVAIPSFEGMYRTGSRPMVVLNSLRPAGRRAFNCAHELGHHAFNHGDSIDELLERAEDEERRDPKEFAANRFAAALLMPKIAVERAFAQRGWDLRTPTPAQVYLVAGYLGVGYTTLVSYMQGTLRFVSLTHAKMLRRYAPKDIRFGIVGAGVPYDLVVVDEMWEGRPIDLEVGDVALLPDRCSVEGTSLEVGALPSPRLVRAAAPGISQILFPSNQNSLSVRVSRREFTGLAQYRHFEDSDDDD